MGYDIDYRMTSAGSRLRACLRLRRDLSADASYFTELERLIMGALQSTYNCLNYIQDSHAGVQDRTARRGRVQVHDPCADPIGSTDHSARLNAALNHCSEKCMLPKRSLEAGALPRTTVGV